MRLYSSGTDWPQCAAKCEAQAHQRRHCRAGYLDCDEVMHGEFCDFAAEERLNDSRFQKHAR